MKGGNTESGAHVGGEISTCLLCVVPKFPCKKVKCFIYKID